MGRYRRKRVKRSRAWLPETNTEHKAYTVDDWQEQVLSDKTRMGYWAWVREQLKRDDLKDRHDDLFTEGAKA
jgi:hypothetical protein